MSFAIRSYNCTDTQVKVWMNKYSWTENDEGQIFIYNQEESVKPKNIVEKIDFESESSWEWDLRTVMSLFGTGCQQFFPYQRRN